MSDVNLKNLDAALSDIYDLAGQHPSKTKGVSTESESFRFGPALRRWCFRILAFLLMVLLPFVVLIRVSVFFYLTYNLPTWVAVLLGMGLTVLLLVAYGAWFTRRRKKRVRMTWVVRTLVLLVAVYSGYTLVYISASNVKTEAVRSTYTELHPLLRLGVSTFALIDRDLIVTDAARKPEDYATMGLPVFENSLHFPQENGYVHAIDLRTIGRSEWKNALMIGYFRLMGFNTLRHVGTADHLHVSLPVP